VSRLLPIIYNMTNKTLAIPKGQWTFWFLRQSTLGLKLTRQLMSMWDLRPSRQWPHSRLLWLCSR